MSPSRNAAASAAGALGGRCTRSAPRSFSACQTTTCITFRYTCLVNSSNKQTSSQGDMVQQSCMHELPASRPPAKYRSRQTDFIT